VAAQRAGLTQALDRMKHLLVVLAFLLASCSQQAPVASFEERAARAEALENTPTGLAYLNEFIKEHGERLNSFVGECYASTSLQKETFKLVADINSHGKFENVVVQPDSAPMRCYAKKISQLQVSASRPVGYSEELFPVVFIVNYNK